MASDISLVRQLQELDERIEGLTREIDGLPRHIATIQQKLASHKQQLADSRAQLENNGREHRSLEGQIGDFKQKISKLQDQMNAAKTNEQFRAFQHEIQYCDDRIDEIEERILEKMEQAEVLQHGVSEAEADLKIEGIKVAEEVEQAKARIAADREERDRRQADRDDLSARMSPATLQSYSRIRRSRGKAVAPVVGETCGSCHVRLRPKFLQDLRSITAGVMTCENCGLIMYIPESAGGSSEAEDRADPRAAIPGAR